jgi:microcystin-dependent protein
MSRARDLTLLVSNNALFASGGNVGIGTTIPTSTLSLLNGSISGVSSITDASGGYLTNPPGTVISVASSTAPTGYLKANGAAISRSTYSTLFAGIGTVHGAGDGSSTFNVPDLRGEFIRGWDDARAVDTGRTFGSFQDHAIQSHTHTYTVTNDQNTRVVPSTNPAHVFLNQGTAGATTGGATGNTATETRPRNIALLYCIKY